MLSPLSEIGESLSCGDMQVTQAATPGDTRRDPVKGMAPCGCCQGPWALPAHLGRDWAARAVLAPWGARGAVRGNPGLSKEALPQMQIGVMLDLIYFFVLWLLKGEGARFSEERDPHHFPSTACLHVCSRGALPQEDKRPINSHVRPKSILLCAEIASSRDFTN